MPLIFVKQDLQLPLIYGLGNLIIDELQRPFFYGLRNLIIDELFFVP